MVRIVFMGTPDFALPALSILHRVSAQTDRQVVGVVTQPDRRAGRGKRLVVGPVKRFALDQSLPVIQPKSLRPNDAQPTAEQPDPLPWLRMLSPDLIVVAAFGQILPPSVLNIPTYGCLNVHASLLPAYRGASPITAALLDGLTETGVTIMLMDAGMDTGPVLTQATLPVLAGDTTDSLSHRLAALGADLLAGTIPSWLDGNTAPVPQAELPGEPSVCPLVKKQDGRIDWTLPAHRVERMTRAYTPWPAAFTTWKGQNFKLWQGSVIPGQAAPGLVIEVDGRVAVGTGHGLLALHEVQPAGKRRMTAATFLNGAPDFIGARLGS
ncbi:MAG: methionyl-tRNA formyltransferase [Caldilineaceae bacterium SB0668_bin_21]|nr:methionyl-tRNA formyltransferase [Caldilineaceae bacterium SB0668_bin_21]MYC21658.1 methionyl-tRNA formyltransferase [Caldilineaceae bacterium SB0662_bin_25]